MSRQTIHGFPVVHVPGPPPSPMSFDTDSARTARAVPHRWTEMIGEKDKSGNYLIDLSWLHREEVRVTLAETVESLSLKTDKTTGHGYGPFYDQVLSPYHGRTIRLLEIGVERGDSLRLWDAYFGGLAEIVGVDIRMRWGEMELPCNVTLHETNAYTGWAAERLGDFDVIIDDGPHDRASQVAAVRLYAPRLRKWGLLVIEDIPDQERIARLIEVVPPGYACGALDMTREGGPSDDRLFWVRRCD